MKTSTSRLLPDQIHKLRKQLKEIRFIQNGLSLKDQKVTFSMTGGLTTLLGKWHDCQVMIDNLNKIALSADIKKKERIEVKKIKHKISSERKTLFKKINETFQSTTLFI